MKTHQMISITLAVLSLSLGACKKKEASTGTPGMSCSYPMEEYGTQCLDFDTDYGAAVSTIVCDGLSGTFSATTACTSTGRVGRCAITSDGYTNTYSYYSPFDAATVETSCNGSSGTFTPNSIEDEFIELEIDTAE